MRSRTCRPLSILRSLRRATVRFGVGAPTRSASVVKGRQRVVACAGSVGGVEDVIEVAAGCHACARTANAQLYCWGANGGQQLGLGDTVNRLSATLVNRF